MSTRLVKQVLCVLGLSTSMIASAASPVVDLGLVSLDVAKPFSGQVANGSINDLYAFELPSNGGSAYTVLNVPLEINFPSPIGGVGTFNMLLTTFALFSNPDGVVTAMNGDEAVLKAVNSTDPGMSSNQIQFNLGPNAAVGPMFLQVTGTANGSLGGIYSGVILAISPVPESDIWAMMLVGVGLVGFRLRTRSKRASASRLA
jgi:hypothetical protein